MAQSILLCLLLLTISRASRADLTVVDVSKDISINLAADKVDWSESNVSMFDGVDGVEVEDDDDDDDVSSGRRSLFWKRMRYYISYGALSANRVPCPPRSGRSYYTHDCWRARGQAHPYTRGCSAITRCRR